MHKANIDSVCLFFAPRHEWDFIKIHPEGLIIGDFWESALLDFSRFLRESVGYCRRHSVVFTESFHPCKKENRRTPGGYSTVILGLFWDGSFYFKWSYVFYGSWWKLIRDFCSFPLRPFGSLPPSSGSRSRSDLLSCTTFSGEISVSLLVFRYSRSMTLCFF